MRSRALSRASAALAAMLALAPAAASAANPCADGGNPSPIDSSSSGISGTGHAPGDGSSGISGTGRNDDIGISGTGPDGEAPVGDARARGGDDGIGGTGRSGDNGISGTGRSSEDASANARGRSGISGTGRSGDSGITGTGRSDGGASNGISGTGRGSGDDGIGGTGRADADGDANAGPGETEGGIGGTGVRAVLGTVTGFASICVGGIEVELDAPAKTDASPAIGDVVEVLAVGIGEHVRARSLGLHHIVAGPVEDVDDDELRVLGQRVVLGSDARTSIGGTDAPASTKSFGEGTHVRVSGLRRSDGVIVATRIEAASAGEVSLTGRLEPRSGNRARVASVAVALGSVARAASMERGTEVTVRGSWDGETLTATSLDRSHSAFDTAGITAMDVEGYAVVADDGLRIGPWQVEMPASEREAVESGERVQVHATVRPDGSLVAERVMPAIAPLPIIDAAPRGAANLHGGQRHGLPPPPHRGGDAAGNHPGHHGDRPPPPPERPGGHPGERPDRPDRPEPPPDRPERPERPPPRPDRPDRPDRPPR